MEVSYCGKHGQSYLNDTGMSKCPECQKELNEKILSSWYQQRDSSTLDPELIVPEEPRIEAWKQEMKKIHDCPQRQDSTSDQMIDLYDVAVKLGFYDAADYIRQVFIEKRKGS
ncbi:hypothetical protein [Cohnella sp. AR92]|uniref:hypothetical protein n=1 Tax=Cohnella sp. AR92 TaxID=648716 RepID=UPI000F8C54B9|nr:hypothetical protein [Cohnella sp. AR92]RUS44997.1 hypothetical protein ELR57_22340 [Cohnella sp. AR92]